ncbi:uncharacterized protein LOC110719222 [Chenopodium quinoa]|uniref:uncharacterized protein LOC110719222 n=1 Tax=Chenopodium quinoa TaxID=63459 RepID=UPI000B7938CA|nr:uncharacterized protein LOC110719222 [Chenopodium quinoa]
MKKKPFQRHHSIPQSEISQFQLQQTPVDWSFKEEEAQIEAYFNNCTNGIIGKDRKFADLWRDIHREYLAAHLSRPHEIPERNKNMLETHWRRMAADPLIWASVMEEVGKIMGSGYNDSDVVKNAHELFLRSCQNSPRNFKFQYAWGKVNEYPKWRKFMRWGLNKEERKKVDAEHNAEKEVEESSGSGKRTRDDATSCFVSGGISRSAGVKNAKARIKGKGVASEDLTVVGEQMKVYNDKHDVEVTLKQKKLDFDMEKEMRKQRQLELEEKNFQMQQEKMEADKLN